MFVQRRSLLVLALLVAPATAAAQIRKAEPQGVAAAGTIKADKGFIDDSFAFDGSGARLAIVRTDAGTFAEIDVVGVADQKSVARFDFSKNAPNITSIAFAPGGDALFVVGRPTEGADATGFLVDLKGKVLRKFGPGTDVALTEVNGEPAVSVFTSKPAKKGGGTDYTVSVANLETGRPLGKKRSFAADADGFVKALDMSILYWRDGYTHLVGKKKGAYDKLKDQRMNDGEGLYDVVSGTLLRNTPIPDVIAHTRLMAYRVDHQNQSSFLHVPEEQRNVELVTADDRRIPVELVEQFHMYDPKSLVWELGRDGKLWFTLTIDEANPEAINKKRLDPELIDLYALDASGGEAKAKRVARLPRNGPDNQPRRFEWHQGGGVWAVLRKHKGFGRGGQQLELYTLTGK